MEPNQNLLLLAFVTVLLTYGSFRTASPIMAIFSRWAIWILFSFSIAYIAQRLEFDWSQRPFWVLALSAFLLWFLLETGYNWLAISVLSKSQLPFFPKFRINKDGDEWPNQKRFIQLRDMLRKYDFEKIEALKAEIDEGILLRSTIYQSADKTTRVQILFIPQRGGNVSECFTISSLAKDIGGEEKKPIKDDSEIICCRYVTDNFFLPFGGFYPDSWRLERKPWTRSLPALLRRHQQRIKAVVDNLIPWDDSPLDDLNVQQRLIERINTDLGFLFPSNLHEDYGKITWEGRYRVWKELWLLNYLGIAQEY